MTWESSRSAEQRRAVAGGGSGLHGSLNPLDDAAAQDDMWQSLRAEMIQSGGLGDDDEDGDVGATNDEYTSEIPMSGDLTFPVLPSSQVRKRTTTTLGGRRNKASAPASAATSASTSQGSKPPKPSSVSNALKQRTLTHAFSDKEMENLFKAHHNSTLEGDDDDDTACADISRFLQEDDDYDSDDAPVTIGVGGGAIITDEYGSPLGAVGAASDPNGEASPHNLFELLSRPHSAPEHSSSSVPHSSTLLLTNPSSASHDRTAASERTSSPDKQPSSPRRVTTTAPHDQGEVLVKLEEEVFDYRAPDVRRGAHASTPSGKYVRRPITGPGYATPAAADKDIHSEVVMHQELLSLPATLAPSQSARSPDERTPMMERRFATAATPGAQHLHGCAAGQDEDGEGLVFFWTDAKEQSHFMSTDPGSVFLFGRVLTGEPSSSSSSMVMAAAAPESAGGTAAAVAPQRPSAVYESCCIRVRHMYRCVYLLPRAHASEAEVVQEVNELCRDRRIEQRRIKFVQRYYAFDQAELPRERTTWVKLRYPAKYPPLHPRQPMRSIEAILGASTSLLELLLIKRKMKGPCFLRITHATPATHRVSLCTHEYTIESPKHVCVEESGTAASPALAGGSPLRAESTTQTCALSSSSLPRPLPVFDLVSIQLHTHLDSKGESNEVYAVCVAHYHAVNIDASLPDVPHALHVGIREPRPTTAPDKTSRARKNTHNTHRDEAQGEKEERTSTGAAVKSDEAVTLSLDLERHCRAKGLAGVRRFPHERALLEWLSSCLRRIDADFIVGHNFVGFTLSTLLQRYDELGVPGWSALGRLDLKRLPGHGASQAAASRATAAAAASHGEREVCVGRLIVDSYTLAREYYKSVNYKIVALAEKMQLRGILRTSSSSSLPAVSGEPAHLLCPDVIVSARRVLDEVLLPMCHYAVLSMGIIAHLDVLRLTRRLTNIAGNLWSRTLAGARSERIEYLLLHAFHPLKFIAPDRRNYGGTNHNAADGNKRGRVDGLDEGRETSEWAASITHGGGVMDETKRKSRYQGGMVLEPKCGLYSDYTLLLDFNSLYPSLIQEFNICYTTVNWHNGDAAATIPPPESLRCAACTAAGVSASPCLHRCVLPRVIRGLVESRREVKRVMRGERGAAALALLDIRQKALKLTANSMYGCLGFAHSRFHAQPLAELVTQQGRLALQNTVDLIPQINPALRVIYGDTDSVMIQTGVKTDLAAVREMGMELKSRINKRYHNLEIDIDGIFRAILLLKKKKYAALSVVDWQSEGRRYEKEIKGLDMVRRDWCPLSKQVSDSVLNRVLHAEGSEDVLDYLMGYMRDVADHVRRGDRYALDDFVISKSITKEPESYRGSGFPHAAVARRMKQRKMLVRVGDLIPYVMCIRRVPDTGSDTGEFHRDEQEAKSYSHVVQEQDAFHVDEVRSDRSLAVDVEWYLTTQIYPPVMRLCEHIQGFSAVQLSEVMSLTTHVNSSGGGGKARAAAGVSRTADGAAAASADAEVDAADLFDHYNMFRNKDPTECFPTALPLQVVCPHCRVKVPVDPYERVREVIRARAAAAAAPSAEQLRDAEPFDLYVCNSCHRSIAVDYVANTFTHMCHVLVRQFYQSGGGASAVQTIRNQFTYFRALFDVPHAPGCGSVVRFYHRSLARRCLGMDRRLYTLEQAAQPAIADAHDPVDPLSAVAETFYKRLEHMFIHLGSLFKNIKVDIHESATVSRAELALAASPAKGCGSPSK